MLNSSSLSSTADPNAMAQRLIQKAHNRDGLPEIAVGLTFLMISGLIYAQLVLRRASMGSQAAIMALSLGIPLLCLGTPGVLKWVRGRFLVERLGYVRHKPIGRKPLGVGILLAALVAVALFVAVPRLAQPDRWLLAGTGLLGGGLAAWCGRSLRFIIGGVWMAATGVLVAFSGLPLQAGFAVLFGIQGLVTFISGGTVFWRFTRQPVNRGE
jgi:hypothetical protein